MRRTTRIVHYVLAVIALLAMAPTIVVAQSPVCHPVRRGESAMQVARRLTGDSRNAYQTWFQIRNASSRFVPKSQYNRIRGGWQACLFKPIVERVSAKVDDIAATDLPISATATESVVSAAVPASATVSGSSIPVTGSHSLGSEILRVIATMDFTMVWLGAAMVVPWVGWRILEDHLVRKKTRTIVMKHFATRFVHEFERPLVWSPAERAVRSRVRFSARRGRLDILLAPARGRRYPNLSDHKKNLEYDVARVARAIADDSFVYGRLHTQGGWVVVPFQFIVRRSGG